MTLETQAQAHFSTSNTTFSKTHYFYCLLSNKANWILAFAIVAVFLFSKRDFKLQLQTAFLIVITQRELNL